jgi:hypothetical protein
MADKEFEEEAVEARKWLLGMLDCHDKMLDREHQMRMFRSAVEKHMDGRRSDWSKKEQLYMALTEYELTTPEERLRSAFVVVLHLNLTKSLQDVSTLVAIRTERLERASTREAELLDVHENIFEKAHSIKVDHFACAIPLSLLTATANASVIDDNAGCCPICQNSYTALSAFGEGVELTPESGTDAKPPEVAFRIEDLLADFPVRIKHCGHIVGKACLEQWMATPKIEEAKYPHRTCPLCRIKIEGIKSPEMPQALLNQLKTDRGALETVRELVYGYGMELRECLDTMVACMSEEIACRELLAKIGGKDKDREEKVLRDRLHELRKEKWAWGFRGDGVWRQLRDEWMNSGVVRKE